MLAVIRTRCRLKVIVYKDAPPPHSFPAARECRDVAA